MMDRRFDFIEKNMREEELMEVSARRIDRGHPVINKTGRQPFYRRALSILLCVMMLFSNASQVFAEQTLTIPFGTSDSGNDITLRLEDGADASAAMPGVILPDETEENGTETQTDAESVSDAEETESEEETVFSEDREAGADPAYTEQSEAENDPAVLTETEPETENDSVSEIEAETETEKEDAIPEKREYTYEDRYVNVTVTLTDPAAVPDDAELVVTPVTANSSEYNYNAYVEALNEAAVTEHTGEDFLLYDFAFMVEKRDDPGNPTGEFYEFQPAGDTMHVNVTFKRNQLTNRLKPEEPEKVEVIHLPLVDEVRESVDSTAQASEISAGDIVVAPLSTEATSVNLEGSTDNVDFVTDSFSVFAFTVDFTYRNYTYRMPGNGQIALSELADILGIPASISSEKYASGAEFASQVRDIIIQLVQQNDPEVSPNEFYALQEGSDWLLRSDEPFGNVYEMILKMNDGSSVIVTVTDSQESTELVNFITNAVITGATQDPDGSYHVESGEEYSIILSFAESSNNQFDNTGTLTYQMPEGITILTRQENDGNINIVYKGRTYQVGFHYVLETDGSLKIEFDQSDPDFPRLEESTNVSFSFTYTGEFDGSKTKIIFNDVVERDITFDEPEPGQAYVEKTGVFDEETGKILYTITVRATGDVTDVNVRDVISGNALKFENDVLISGNSGSYTDNHAVNGSITPLPL